MATPYALEVFPRTDSTQDDARSAFVDEPVLIVAGSQRLGRGRRGRPWLEAPRALAASLAWRPSWPTETWPRIGLVAGLAARSVLARHTPSPLSLKWPNDIVSVDGKLGGLLIESSEDCAVAGFGANLWWPVPPAGFATLESDDPGPQLAVEIAGEWADEILARTAKSSDDWGRAEYEEHCATIGRLVRWKPDGSGVAVGVASDGSLRVNTSSGRQQLTVSEVWEIREDR